MPDDLTLHNAARFPPIFILVKDGIEMSRIEGYPGEAFFWQILAQMLDRACPGTAAAPTAC